MLANTASPTVQPIAAPVIFLPGTLCDERIWQPVWQAMNIQQRAYVPLQWAESMEHMLALSADRINSFEEPVHLIGFSMGGYVAALSALDKANAENIASITLVAYNPYGLTDVETNARLQMLKSIKQKKLKGLDNQRLAQYFTSEELTQPELVQPILDMEADLGNSVLYAHMNSTTPRQDLAKQLSKLSIKQHWLSAQYDKIAPALSIQKYCQQTKHATLTHYEKTGHILPLTRTFELAKDLGNFILEHN